MPKYEHRTRILPPARLSAADFKAIEQSLGAEFSSSTTWSFWDHQSLNITNKSLDDLLDEVSDVVGLTDFEIDAESPDASITISAGEAGCILEYDTSHALGVEIAAKARAIEGIFRDRKRFTAYLPNFPSAFRRPAIELGLPRRGINVSRDEIIQGILTRWLSALLTAPITFGIGVLVGLLL